ncbi:hypothetical protein J6590_090688, partial [Homalodisca vitripennis]
PHLGLAYLDIIHSHHRYFIIVLSILEIKRFLVSKNVTYCRFHNTSELLPSVLSR